MDCVLAENKLYLPFGTSLSINKQISHKQFQLINEGKHNEFVAIFDENDIDFLIICDNRVCDRGIGVVLTINNVVSKRGYLAPQSLSAIISIGNEGNYKKLHLLSQNTKKGLEIVDKTALKCRSSFEIASINCSKIKFEVYVEKSQNKITNLPLNTIDICLINPLGEKICVFIEIVYANKVLSVVIGLQNTVRDLKKIINKCTAIPLEQQQLVYGNRLTDSLKLVECNLIDRCTVYMYPIHYGGGDLPSDNSWQSPQSYVQLEKIQKDEFSYSDYETDEIKTKTSSASQLFSGERAVVCEGEPIKPKIIYSGFVKDPDIMVNSFIIEMRMESRFA